MRHKEEGWGWMLAVDMFCAGMGAAIMLINALFEILVPGSGPQSIFLTLAGPALIALGAAFLLLELGRPLQGWRVFMNPGALLTKGAWMMLISIGIGALYASFSVDIFPWVSWVWLRKLLAVSGAFTALFVATYPGVLLGGMQARPSWRGPAMAALFLLSSLSTGLAAYEVLVFFSSASGSGLLQPILITFLGLQLLLWPLYAAMKAAASTAERTAIQFWTRGRGLIHFILILSLGMLLPVIFYLTGLIEFILAGHIMVCAGGLWMRLRVISAGTVRTWLPGEQVYLSRLPGGDEAFLTAWLPVEEQRQQ